MPIRRPETLATAYSLTVGLAGLAALAWMSAASTAPLSASLLVLFFTFSLIIKLLGFHIAADVTHSLGGTVDLAALLVLGAPQAGWPIALGSLVATALASRGDRGVGSGWIAPALFNAGLKAVITLVCGLLLRNLGASFPPRELTAPILVGTSSVFITWVGLDHLGWAILELLRTGRNGLIAWLRSVLVASILVELAPLPLSLLIAAVYGALGITPFVLSALLLGALAAVVGRLAEATFTLRQRVAELTALNRMGQEILQARLDVDRLCELIYEEASRIVDTSTFQLGLFHGDEYELKVWVRQGRRQAPARFPQGGSEGIIGWLRQSATPLLVRDFAAESGTLPASPSYVSPDPPRSAVFVPLLSENRVVGAIAIQSFRPGAFRENHVRLLSNIANQAAAAIENALLQAQAEEKKKLERELEVARQIQSSLLPGCCPLIPGYQLTAEWRSARQVGGDFYDYFALPDGRWGILIADVSGNGVPAAIFMALSRSLIRSGVIGAASLSAGLRRANAWILKDTTSGLFVTVFYAVLDPARHVFTYVNCGHNPPLLIRAKDASTDWLSTKGIALGIVEEIDLEEKSVTLDPGDSVLCYTDGITEARDQHDQLFGRGELLATALTARERGSDPIQTILEALAAHVGDTPQADDITLLSLQRAPGDAVTPTPVSASSTNVTALVDP